MLQRNPLQSERQTGFEPATLCLGSKYSTTELLPLINTIGIHNPSKIWVGMACLSGRGANAKLGTLKEDYCMLINNYSHFIITLRNLWQKFILLFNQFI